MYMCVPCACLVSTEVRRYCPPPPPPAELELQIVVNHYLDAENRTWVQQHVILMAELSLHPWMSHFWYHRKTGRLLSNMSSAQACDTVCYPVEGGGGSGPLL